MGAPKTPALTVDVIIKIDNKIVLIKRKNPPYGWALPGGFVDIGETVESAALREAKEETNLDVRLTKLLGVYSDPKRDERGHTVSIVYVAEGSGVLQAKDDAIGIELFEKSTIPSDLAFDHNKILNDYFLQE